MAPTPTTAVGASAVVETNDEIALYDRQIRLWGVKAQEKIRNASILLITMKGLANEVAKNLVLAGIGSLTVVDHEFVTEVDLGTQFFLSAEQGHLGMNRAEAASTAIRKLNPRVKVHVDTDNIRNKSASYFAGFDIVIATDLDPVALNIINTATRLNKRAFYAAGSHGLFGFIFADLVEHDYVIERAKSNVATPIGKESNTRSVVAVDPKNGDATQELVTKRELYSTWFLSSDTSALPDEIIKSPRRRKAVTPALSCLRALWEYTQLYGRPPNTLVRSELAQFTILCGDKHKALGLPSETLNSEFLRGFMQNIGCEIAPVTAVLGGQLAQDVIGVLGQNLQPIQNFVIFDGNTMEASMYPLHPEGELGSNQLKVSASAVMMPVGILPPVDMTQIDLSQLPVLPNIDPMMPPPPPQ
ncbi:hypothetical protein GQ53DRAFT_783242 [Thozetella sp. PMI_491]|nr:hypothetical protein GQ53DRAFT_783242 [Thozetella sp. PMI_491]